MLTREEYVKQISDMLAILQKGIEFRGINNLYDTNIIAEDFVKHLLNAVYNYELENLNLQKESQPGIDLGDETNSVAFQVTSTRKRKKIQKTINTFIKDALYKKYSELFIFIISEKQRSYAPFNTQGYFEFVPEKNILDFGDIVRDVRSLNLGELIEVFELLQAEVNFQQLTREQLTPAEQYQIALHWAENGRKESLYGFNLSGCSLWGADLERADLRLANLLNAVLVQANLQKANLGGADLRGANLEESFLHEAIIDEKTLIDEKWRLVWEIIRRGFGAHGRNLRGIDLSRAVLTMGDLSESDLSRANLRYSNLSHANMRKAILRETDLRSVYLSSAILSGADTRRALLAGADLRQADLSETDLRDTDLSEATLNWGDPAIDSLLPGTLQGAKYNKITKWPMNFDPIEAGAVLVNEN